MKVEPRLYKRVFVWSWALRLFHWTFALSIFTLIITGLFINHPITTTSWGDYRASFVMGTIRFLHFTAAYFFIAAMILRIYLFFFGNTYEKGKDFLPVNKENLSNLKETLKYYFYLSDYHALRAGHNVLAGTTYFLIFLCALVLIFSGLYLLYPETQFLKSLGKALFGTQQKARFIHFLCFPIFILFVLFHIYIVIWNEIKSPEGLISSIFSGWKFLPEKKRD